MLLVEDNTSNIHLIRGIFSQMPDITLETATHGRDALDLLATHEFDLILLDNHLPDTTGVELLGRIKADPRVAHLPVVMISADATAGQIESAFAAGATSYLTKPIDVKQFLAVVDSAVSPPATETAALTVLYVEDDDMNRNVMRRVFETYLPEVALDVAVDGTAALRAVHAAAPRLLIVDRGLPDMSGLSLISSLQSHEVTASIPVLILSGDPPPADWTASAEVEYLTKPYDIVRLVELIRRMLHIA